jgi:hypothetical protein
METEAFYQRIQDLEFADGVAFFGVGGGVTVDIFQTDEAIGWPNGKPDLGLQTQGRGV